MFAALVVCLVFLGSASKASAAYPDGSPQSAHANLASVNSPAIYWGAWVSGKTYGLPSDPPWDMSAVDRFEADVQKKISILHFGLPWFSSDRWPRGYYPFVPALFDKIRNRGIIPLVDWAAWDLDASPDTHQPAFALNSIIRGDHDAYIRQWAIDAKKWAHPFFLRFNWEMNGTWYPWSESQNGNAPGQYVQAWQHVHDIFRRVGATNVTWVWCPNTEYPGSIPIDHLYPGDDYVDWVCVDVYNYGTHPAKPDRWKSFDELFKPIYEHLGELAPTKPMMIAELGSTEVGGSKAAWIDDAMTTQLPNNYSRVKAVLWFNWNAENMDWAIESSPSSQATFAKSITSPLYATNTFRAAESSPIMPLSSMAVNR